MHTPWFFICSEALELRLHAGLKHTMICSVGRVDWAKVCRRNKRPVKEPKAWKDESQCTNTMDRCLACDGIDYPTIFQPRLNWCRESCERVNSILSMWTQLRTELDIYSLPGKSVFSSPLWIVNMWSDWTEHVSEVQHCFWVGLWVDHLLQRSFMINVLHVFWWGIDSLVRILVIHQEEIGRLMQYKLCLCPLIKLHELDGSKIWMYLKICMGLLHCVVEKSTQIPKFAHSPICK